MNKELFINSLPALFQGCATPLQKSQIDAALSDPEYRELYFTVLEEWETKNPQMIADTEKAFEKWNNLVNKDTESSGGNHAGVTFLGPRFWLAAMSLTLLFLVGVIFSDQILRKTLSTGYAELKTFNLDDGSKVTLNANSTLRLARFGFGKNDRDVFLEGEAEFNVSHLKDAKPFVVRTRDSLTVTVLGTEFVVYSREKGSKVALSKGKVELKSGAQTDAGAMLMKPGDVVSVSREGKLSWAHDQPDNIHNAWKEHRFAFDNTSLSQIADQLNDVFGVNIIISDSLLARRTIGGTYHAESADKVLRILADILEVRVISDHDKKTKTYTITY